MAGQRDKTECHCNYVCVVPTDVPVNFVLDPRREVTNTTADFVWDAINASSPGLNGFLRGYKVKDDIRIMLISICKPTF